MCIRVRTGLLPRMRVHHYNMLLYCYIRIHYRDDDANARAVVTFSTRVETVTSQ